MIHETWSLTDTEMVTARRKLFHGYNDLGTEQALKWCVTKHPHPLNEVLEKCAWCILERKALEAVHCATRCSDEAWWKDLIDLAHKERDEAYLQTGGFCRSFVRVGLPDGRWWYLCVIDSKAVPNELAVLKD